MLGPSLESRFLENDGGLPDEYGHLGQVARQDQGRPEGRALLLAFVTPGAGAALAALDALGKSDTAANLGAHLDAAAGRDAGEGQDQRDAIEQAKNDRLAGIEEDRANAGAAHQQALADAKKALADAVNAAKNRPLVPKGTGAPNAAVWARPMLASLKGSTAGTFAFGFRRRTHGVRRVGGRADGAGGQGDPEGDAEGDPRNSAKEMVKFRWVERRHGSISVEEPAMPATEGFTEFMELVRATHAAVLAYQDVLRRGQAAAGLGVLAWQAGDGRAADLEEEHLRRQAAALRPRVEELLAAVEAATPLLGQAWRRRAQRDPRPRVLQRLRREAAEAGAAGARLQALHARGLAILE